MATCTWGSAMTTAGRADWDDDYETAFDVQQGSASPALGDENTAIKDLLLDMTADAVKLRQLMLEADHETFERARTRLEGLMEVINALPAKPSKPPRQVRVIGFQPAEPKKSRGARKPRRR